MSDRKLPFAPKSDPELWAVLTILPSDYTDYGGDVERWADDEGRYPDCSCVCKWFLPLYNEEYDSFDCDWGVCTNPVSPRKGLLTWEHQAGVGCGYEFDRDWHDKHFGEVA